MLASCAAYETPGERTVGELTDDVAIHAIIKRRFVADPDIDGLRIDIDVHQGVVRLTGNVADEAVRAKAVRLSGTVRGVMKVVDSLSILNR